MVTSDEGPQILLDGVATTVTDTTSRSRSGSPASRSPSHSNGSVRHGSGGGQRGPMMRSDSEIKKSFTNFTNFTKGVAKKMINKTVKQNMRADVSYIRPKTVFSFWFFPASV